LTPPTISARLLTLIAVLTLVTAATATAYMQTRKAPPQEPAKPASRVSLKGLPQEVKDKAQTEKVTGQAPVQDVITPQIASSNNYVFTTATNGSLTDMSTGTTTLVAADQDDTASSVFNIGFDFYFQGVRFTQFSANSNGLMRLGATAVQGGSPYKPLAQASIPLITPYGADQRTLATTGKVHAKVIGTAPNRALVVEWLNMQSNFNSGGAADLTYQARLSETTGIIEYVYGNATMSTAGAADVNSKDPNIGFSSSNTAGTVGSVTAPQTGTPAPTYNGASATPVANTYTAGTITVLNSAANSSRRVFTFTPPTATAPTNLTFTAVTPSSMTLNWTDSPDEQAYAIFNSTDGTNFNFVTQPAQNATSQNVTGLTPSTTYTWRVLAVSEGAVSSALSGSQATTAPGNITSNAVTGNWSATTTWAGGVVPTAGDNVTIANGATVTIDVAANAYSLTVGQGTSGILQYASATAQTLTVGTDVTIASSGTFRSNTAGTITTHSLSLGGNLTNNGTLDFSTNTNTAGAGITFTGAANNTFGGTGATTDVRAITINKGTTTTPVLELNTSNFTVQGVTTDVAGFLTLTSGTFKLSGTFAGTNRVFTAAAYTIGTGATPFPGFWLNNANYTVAAQNGSPTVNGGLLRVTTGTFNIGTASGNTMTMLNGSSVIVEGGAVNVAGRLSANSATSLLSYNQSAGTVTVNTAGNISTTLASFDTGTASTSSFTISGGTIVTQLAGTGASGPRDFRNSVGIQSITGGTLQLGNASSGVAKTFNIQGSIPNFIISNASANHSATCQGQTNIFGNSTVSSGTTLTLNGQFYIQIGASFTNNGTVNGTTASSRFYFLGSGAQTYSGSGLVTAPLASLDMDNPSGLTLSSTNQIITSRVDLFRGTITNSNKITLGNGGVTTAATQFGVAAGTTPGGSYDQSPVFNAPGSYGIVYAQESVGRTTGFEIPASRDINFITEDNTNNVTLSGGDLTITTIGANVGAVTLTNGRFITGSNTLIINSATTQSTVTRTNGYVDGNLRKTYTATGSKTFEVGTANGYSPVAANVTAGTGSFTAKAVQGKQPNISGANALSRYWTLTATGLTADLTFNYLAGDVIGTEANYKIFKYNGGFTQFNPTTLNTATHVATLSGISSFSDWTLAEPTAIQSGSLQFSSATYTDSETNTDHTFNVPVTRTGGTDGAVSVDYAVTDGTANAGSDYTVSPATGTLNWAAGDAANKNITITVKGDTTFEPDETINFAITNPQGGATLGSPSIAILTITNDDPTPKYRSAASGNWNSTSTWETSPDGNTWTAAVTTPNAASGTITVRSPHVVTVTASVDADQLTVDSGGKISVNNGVTFTIADGTGTDLIDSGTVATAGTITDNGQALINDTLQIDQGGFPGGGTGTYAYDQTNGVLVFNNTSGSFGVNNVNFWPTTNGPQNVNVKNPPNGGITMNVARTVNLLFQYAAGVSGAGNLTLNGIVQVNIGGFTSGSPTYGASSLLKYNTGGTYGRNGEWLPNATSGAGYPNNVQLSNNTTLDLANSSTTQPFQMAGTLTIDSGSTMQLAGSTPLTQPLTVLGSVNINGTLNLSTALGGDLVTQGNFTNNGTFAPNNRAVFFTGGNTQTASDGSGTLTMPYVRINKSGGTVQLNSDLTTLGPGGGDSIQFTGATSTLTLNGRTLTLGSTIGSIPAGSGFVGSNTSKMSLQDGGSAGAMGTLVFVSGSETLQNLTMNRTGGAGSVTLGSPLTVNGTLTLTNGIINTGSNVLTLGASATSTGASNASYVFGNLKKIYATTGSFTFDVGDAGYSPVMIDATAGSGDVTAKAIHEFQPRIGNTTRALQRYWRLTNNGITQANLTFQYQASDVPGTANEPLFQIFKIDGNTVAMQPGVVNAVSHNATAPAVTSFSDWTLAEAIAPTAVKLINFDATSDSGLVRLEWNTGYEARNLGFNLYREQNGRRTRVTPSMLAGSALLTGPRSVLTAGHSYTWFDTPAQDKGGPAQYWLEDVDINGARTLHGPIVPSAGKTASRKIKGPQAEVLGQRQQIGAGTGLQINGWPAASHGSGEVTAVRADAPGIARAKQTIQVGTPGRGVSDGPPNAGPGPLPTPQYIEPETGVFQRQIADMAGVKFNVSKDGWYRISQPELVAAGLDSNVIASHLQLFAGGVEVPMRVSGNGQQLTASDVIEFYGAAADLPSDGTQTYYLVQGQSYGKRIMKFVDKDAPPMPPPGGPDSFAYTLERKERLTYFPGLDNGEADNFFGQIITSNGSSPVLETLNVKHPYTVAASGAQAQLEISLQGVTSGAHQVQVLFNGTDAGVINFADTEHIVQAINVPAANVIEGDNVIQLASLGGDTDISLADTVRLTYAHAYVADNDALSISVGSEDTVRVNGFTNGSVRVVDITDANNSQELTPVTTAQPDGSFSVDTQVIGANNNGPRTLIVFADNVAAHPDSLRNSNPSHWAAEDAGADFLIISHRSLMGSVQPLAELRRSQGMVVDVIDVEDIYDEFSFGAHSPQAIHEFIKRAANSWKVTPRYVLLVGDATYDPRNYLGQGANDMVPTKLLWATDMKTASDDWMADMDGDSVPELAVGRLPVRTASEASILVSKIINYVPGQSAQGALLVADHANGNDFEGASSALGGQLPAGMPVQIVNRGTQDANTVRSQIIGNLNQGPQVVNYFGHGSVGLWTGAGLLTTGDAANLQNGNRLPLFTMMTCLNGYFHDVSGDSLAEALLKAPNGGAVAVWASSGQTNMEGQLQVAGPLYQLLFGGQAMTLGDAVRGAKNATGDQGVRRSWIFFGDPTQRIR
jgi:hypothetical protein